MFLFEFMDHPRTPRVLRETLLDVLDYCNTDFRPYYREVSGAILEVAGSRHLTTVVEVGAGLAPVTRVLADCIAETAPVSGTATSGITTLIPSDLYPERDAWRWLEQTSPQLIKPVYEPVDFTQRRDWGDRAVVILCAALHHIPQPQRRDVLLALHDSSDCVLVFEPIRKTPVSMFLVLFAVIPALLTPLFRWKKAGIVRRLIFCWLLPIVPLMFVWDGLVPCLRQWNGGDWMQFQKSLPDGCRPLQVTSTPHSQTVIW